MRFEGSVIHDPKKIAVKWSEFFAKLYTPKEDVRYDNEFKRKVESEIEKMTIDSFSNSVEILDSPFSLEEIELCIRELKNGKSGGLDGLKIRRS